MMASLPRTRRTGCGLLPDVSLIMTESRPVPKGSPTAIRRQNSMPAHTNGTQPRMKTIVSSVVIPRGSNFVGSRAASSAIACGAWDSSKFESNRHCAVPVANGLNASLRVVPCCTYLLLGHCSAWAAAIAPVHAREVLNAGREFEDVSSAIDLVERPLSEAMPRADMICLWLMAWKEGRDTSSTNTERSIAFEDDGSSKERENYLV
mmetsp:Transcript_7197/g.15935  ORF Transcript_7197/g.15935 Transcript_7197/m.15935 type:complete len:206 (-) Transcript_7197:123-740(-)